MDRIPVSGLEPAPDVIRWLPKRKRRWVRPEPSVFADLRAIAFDLAALVGSVLLVLAIVLGLVGFVPGLVQ